MAPNSRTRFFVELVALVAAISVAAFVVWLGYDQEHQAKRLAVQGVSTQGIVIEKKARAEAVGGRYSGQPEMKPRYWIKFSFSDVDGGAYVQEKTVSYLTFGELLVGQEIEVTYLPENPNISEFLEGRVNHSAWGLKIFGFAALAFCLFAGWAFVMKQIRYNQSGT